MPKTYLDILDEIIKLSRSSAEAVEFKADLLERAVTNLIDSYEDYRKNDKEVEKYRSEAINTFNKFSRGILQFLSSLQQNQGLDDYDEYPIYFKQFLTIVRLIGPKNSKDPNKALSQNIIKLEINNLERIFKFYIENPSNFELQQEGMQIRILISSFAHSSKDRQFEVRLNNLLDNISSVVQGLNVPINKNILLVLKDCLLELGAKINESFHQMEGNYKKGYRLLSIKLITTLAQICEKSELKKDYDFSQKLYSCLIQRQYDFKEIDDMIKENFCSNNSELRKSSYASTTTSMELRILEQLMVAKEGNKELEEENKKLKEQLTLSKTSTTRLRCIIS